MMVKEASLYSSPHSITVLLYNYYYHSFSQEWNLFYHGIKHFISVKTMLKVMEKGKCLIS